MLKIIRIRKKRKKNNENRISTLLKTKMKGTRSSYAEHVVVQKESLEETRSSELLHAEVLDVKIVRQT